ncbi:MAG: hypothetical protein AAF212_06880, partial [Verrucomicrobiota bacterium]
MKDIFESSHSSHRVIFIYIGIFLAFAYQSQAFDFEETDGILVIEAEDANNIDQFAGAWRVETDEPQIDPFDRSQDDGAFYRNDAVHGTYIRSLIRREPSVQQGKLSYIIKINTSGTYRFVMRGNMFGPEETHDQYNDIWMRIRGHNGSASPDLALQPGEDPEEVGPSGGTYRKAYTLNWSRRQARNPRQMFTN